MSIIGNAIRSNFRLGVVKPCFGVSSLHLHEKLPKHFSTEAGQPASSSLPSPQGDASNDQILRPSNTGMVYGKLWGTTKQTLKTDVINYFEGCNLTLDDVRVKYNAYFAILGMLVQFPSRFAYENAQKIITRKGRLYRLEKTDRTQWDFVAPYDGKTLLLQGLSRTTLPEDVERFLSGCDYDASSMQIFSKPSPAASSSSPSELIRMALIRCPTRQQAVNAFITKNRDFCQNNQITVRVLQ